MIRNLASQLSCAIACAVLATGQATADEKVTESTIWTAQGQHMPESVRAGVSHVIVIAGQTPGNREVGGTYDQYTPGLIGGMDEGARMGRIEKEIGGLPVSIPIPILTIPGMIYGGLTGAAKRELQEFRDALTEELAKADAQTLSSQGLAEDVYFALRELPHLKARIFAPTTPVPEDVQAVLYVDLSKVGIDVQGDDAVLTVSARATVRRLADGIDLYDRVVDYQDRAALGDWIANDNALWHSYANFARHYLGREISAEIFDRVRLSREFGPRETDTAELKRKNDWHVIAETAMPELAWDLKLTGSDTYGAWTEAINPAEIVYDLEIYDHQRLVYAVYQLPEARHVVGMELPCGIYRFTVRPNYRVENGLRFGSWMDRAVQSEERNEPWMGPTGRNAAEVPAYIQGYPLLEVECSR